MISAILAKGGPPATNLINNFAALASSMKALSSKITLVGFDLDNEDASISAGVPLVVALYNHGIQQSPRVEYPFTFCAFGGETEWFQALSGVYSKLKVQPVVGITLQTYSGGSGNVPTDWTKSLETYLLDRKTSPCPDRAESAGRRGPETFRTWGE